MKAKIRIGVSILIISVIFLPNLVLANDRYLEDPPQSGTYASFENLVARNNCVINPGISVTFIAPQKIFLSPGFRIKSGGRLSARIEATDTDQDGLFDWWELAHFQLLTWAPDDDPDGDGINNIAEYQSGTDPGEYHTDHDGDGLLDWWEATHFTNLDQGADDDPDGDGYTNGQEQQLGFDPTLTDKDLYLYGALNSGDYPSAANIIALGSCVIPAGSRVTLKANFDNYFKPGFRVQAGSRLVVKAMDNDGLSNKCEMQYFGTLEQGPNDDPDNDRLNNIAECTLGTNPALYVMDSDADDLPDWWEVDNFGYTLANHRNQDSDGDGVTNYVEFKLGANPAQKDLPGPGVHYEYDALGRLKKIYRIPAQ